ncbi:DUF6300 family protein [Nocardia sp. NPDC051052]|uniref:DUF6300 family protein n=1 Tax=Nocardia sp. NPDC051052 TaxID=3364322 RepID=UPI00379D6BAC
MTQKGDGRSGDPSGPDCELLLVDDLPCHRCGDTLICSVRAPHSFLREDGTEVRGTRTVGLCPNCDKGNPAARAVIDHFVGYREMAESRLPEAAMLLGEWLTEVLPAQVDGAQLAMLRPGGSSCPI